MWRRENLMREFYERFYATVPASRAYALFCERAFGRDLSQHGFADMEQLEAIIEVTGLGPTERVLDVGCGNGRIAEYLAERTGAHVTGLDYIPEAIRQARERTAAKVDRLAFLVGDIKALGLPAGTFDTIFSIDTLYFSDDLTRTLRELCVALRPGGQMAILYTYGWEPAMSLDDFDARTLQPAQTPLGEALTANGLRFQTQDWTATDCRLTQLRGEVLRELEPQFRAEGLGFLHENRMGEVVGTTRSHELGLLRRYLYHVKSARARHGARPAGSGSKDGTGGRPGPQTERLPGGDLAVLPGRTRQWQHAVDRPPAPGPQPRHGVAVAAGGADRFRHGTQDDADPQEAGTALPTALRLAFVPGTMIE
jgi:SAM-dependent methyltransferase